MRKSPVIGVLLALSTCLAQGQQYRLKESDAVTGSNIKREIARATIPHDKPYAELSPADKAELRAMYESMGPNDEPPFPSTGYSRLMRALAEVRRRVLITGTFDLGVVVGADGRASEIKVYHSPDPKLTTVVANVLMLEKYKPALCNGKPCIQEFPFIVTFETRR